MVTGGGLAGDSLYASRKDAMHHGHVDSYINQSQLSDTTDSLKHFYTSFWAAIMSTHFPSVLKVSIILKSNVFIGCC